ncbi:MAG: MBL fold metallo-hydrolase [Chloroflexia bacterium]
MRVQILGAHQGESRDIRFMSILIDDHLVIDAGGLTSSLSLDQQVAIEAVLITHRHFDHIKDLPMLAHNTWELHSLEIYSTEETLKMIQAHLFNGEIWPAMLEDDPPYHRIVYHPITPGTPFALLDYEVQAVTMPHSVPTVGYLVQRGPSSFFYTADTRTDGEPNWIDLRPDLLIIETTMSNAFDKEAARFGHMTPMALGKDLRAFHKKQGYYPRTVCVHINPRHAAQVHKELAQLSADLKTEILPGQEGMVIDL